MNKLVAYPRTKLEDAEWTPIDPAKVVSGLPRSTYRILHSNPSKEFYSGVYECSPGKWHVHYQEDEFCVLLEGTVIMEDDKGQAHEFHAPDSFMIPYGWKGTWEAVTYVRKLFAIYEKIEPKPDPASKRKENQ